MTQQDKDKAALEAWEKDSHELYKMPSGEYASRISRLSLEAWNAALEYDRQPGAQTEQKPAETRTDASLRPRRPHPTGASMSTEITLPALPEPLSNLPGHCRNAIEAYAKQAIREHTDRTENALLQRLFNQGWDAGYAARDEE